MVRTILLCFALVIVPSAHAWSAERTLVVLGDSLSSGYGMDVEESWVALLAEHLDGQAYGYDVVNASIAGDTSAGALARLPRVLETHEPDVVIIELGGNDGLRGQPVAALRQNLSEMVELTLEAGAVPVLAGMRIPPNYGLTYTESFAAVYPRVAAAYDVPLVEFFMEGVALNPELMQGDGIHPTAAAQQTLFENVWRVLAAQL